MHNLKMNVCIFYKLLRKKRCVFSLLILFNLFPVLCIFFFDIQPGSVLCRHDTYKGSSYIFTFKLACAIPGLDIIFHPNQTYQEIEPICYYRQNILSSRLLKYSTNTPGKSKIVSICTWKLVKFHSCIALKVKDYLGPSKPLTSRL